MAGGLGTRMKSAKPKHLHPILGRRMVDWVVEAARDADVERIVVVASPDSAGSYDGLEVAVQEEARGTGDAVLSATPLLPGEDPALLTGPDRFERYEVVAAYDADFQDLVPA